MSEHLFTEIFAKPLALHSPVLWNPAVPVLIDVLIEPGLDARGCCVDLAQYRSLPEEVRRMSYWSSWLP